MCRYLNNSAFQLAYVAFFLIRCEHPIMFSAEYCSGGLLAVEWILGLKHVTFSALCLPKNWQN